VTAVGIITTLWCVAMVYLMWAFEPDPRKPKNRRAELEAQQRSQGEREALILLEGGTTPVDVWEDARARLVASLPPSIRADFEPKPEPPPAPSAEELRRTSYTVTGGVWTRIVPGSPPRVVDCRQWATNGGVTPYASRETSTTEENPT
jgi:hypothetical protein